MKNSKTFYFLICSALIIIFFIILNSYNGRNNNEFTFGKITIGEKFNPKSFSEEFDVIQNNKVMNNYEFPDHTKIYVDRIVKLQPRKNNPNGDENNYLKFMSDDINVGLNEDKKINIVSFDIINENNNFNKILKTIKDKDIKIVSRSISKMDNGKGFDYTIQYTKDKESKIITVLSLQSSIYYDIISEENLNIEIKLSDIQNLSISFYDKSMIENQGDINVF